MILHLIESNISPEINIKFCGLRSYTDKIDKICEVIAKKKNTIHLDLDCPGLSNKQSEKILQMIKNHKNIKTLHIKRDDLSFGLSGIATSLSSSIEKCMIDTLFVIGEFYSDYNLRMIEEKCRFNKINNRVPIYMMMLRKRADCIVSLLPRRVLMYLLGFINSRWI